jgi:hypothetical protein
VGETPQAALQRERIRDLFSCEVALGQLVGDQHRVCGALSRTYCGRELRDVADRINTASGNVQQLLAQAERELHDLRRHLMRERAGRNLPPALPFEETNMRRNIPRDALPSAFTGPQPALQRPHPDLVVPRCMPYHTPVWDALIWRFVQRVDPTGCSQEAHMLRNYPPYAVTHSAPLEPEPSPTLPVVIDALSTMSLHEPAVAAASPLPPFNGGGGGACDAPVEVDAADGGTAWHDSAWSAPCVSEGEGELEIDDPDAREPDNYFSDYDHCASP